MRRGIFADVLRSPLGLVLALALAIVTTPCGAQESGGSFGGSAWDDEPSGGGGGSIDYGGGGGFTGGGAAPQDDWAERQAQAERDRQEAERRAEEARRAEEEARRAEEEARQAAERARLAEEARRAAERARRLALPPSLRVADLPWPATPAFPRVASPRVLPLEAPLAPPAPVDDGWAPREPATIAPASLPVVGPPSVLDGFVCGAPTAMVLLALALVITRLLRPSSRTSAFVPVPGPPATSAGAPPRASERGPAGPAMRLSIAFDWTVRAQLQAELAALATRFDLRTRPGLASGARATASLLAASAHAARYASWELSTGDPRAWFQARANDARARYRAELVRNDAVRATPEYRAREDEGAGLVVVTVVVAGKAPIVPPPARFDAAALESAIARIAPGATDPIVALEVIWSPAADDDRMSSYELEKLYPELQRIAEGVGARECRYCHAAFPTELGRCPSCGAPV